MLELVLVVVSPSACHEKICALMPPKKGGAKDPAEEAAALVADLSAAADAAATAAALAALGTFAEAEGAALVAEGAALVGQLSPLRSAHHLKLWLLHDLLESGASAYQTIVWVDDDVVASCGASYVAHYRSVV